MEAHVEPVSHRTTLLLPPSLHERLTRLARERGVSMGHLIRAAVEAQYGRVDVDRRRSAVDELGALCLPVDAPGTMKAESDPYGTDPLP